MADRFDGLSSSSFPKDIFQNDIGQLSGLTNSESDQTGLEKFVNSHSSDLDSSSNQASDSQGSESSVSKATNDSTSSSNNESESGSSVDDSNDSSSNKSNSTDSKTDDSQSAPSNSSDSAESTESSSNSADTNGSNQSDSASDNSDTSGISTKDLIHDPDIKKDIQENDPTPDSGESYQSDQTGTTDSSDDDQADSSSSTDDIDQQSDTSSEQEQSNSDNENSDSNQSDDTNSESSSTDSASNSDTASSSSDTTDNTNDTDIGNPSNVAVNPITQRNLRKHALPEDGMQDFKTSDNQLDNMAQAHGAFINVLRVTHKKYGKMPDKDFAKLIAYSNATFKNCQEAIIADRQHIDYRLRQINKDLTDTKHKASNGSKIIQEWKDEGLFSNVSKDMALLDRVVRDPRFQHFVKHLSNGELHQPEQLQEEGERAGAQVDKDKNANGQQDQ